MTLDFFNGWTQRLRFLSNVSGTILAQAQDPAKICIELKNSIEEHNYENIWKFFEQHMQMEGFPQKSIVNGLLSCFAESLDSRWLEEAYWIVDKAFEESKGNLLEKDALIYLSLCLAKHGLVVFASTILRKLVETEQFPHVTAWSAIVSHMSKTCHGAYLAAELIFEMGYLFQDGRIDPRKKINAPLIAMKPNTMAFSIVLAGCLRFGTTRKAEQLLDFMPRIAVKVDVSLLIVMARIYEMNGHRDELKKLQRRVEESDSLTDIQFRQFYNCLLNCHLKFGDLDSASHMVLEMLRKAKKSRDSLASATFSFVDSKKNSRDEKPDGLKNSSSNGSPPLSYKDFCGYGKYSKIEAETKEVLEALLVELETQAELITTKYGILQPTDIVYVKLAKAFLQAGKTKNLAEFLIKAEKENSPVSCDDSALVQVINSCISLGWLDHAHDLLDEMRSSGASTGSSVYSSLLKAYIKANRMGEVVSVMRDVGKAGVQLDSSCYDALIKSRVLQEDTKGALHIFKEMKEARLPRPYNQDFEILVKGCEENAEAGLMAKLLYEVKEGQMVDSGVHDWNNVIHFFSKKRLMQDAEKALKKMLSLGYTPNSQTYHSMVTGYAAIGGKYKEVTELWGEMKSLKKPLKFDQELLDSVLYTFVRGGFFARANEVIIMMEGKRMFIDKYKYRALYLKYHKQLCKGKPPKCQTETQFVKREAILLFKKWLCLL